MQIAGSARVSFQDRVFYVDAVERSGPGASARIASMSPGWFVGGVSTVLERARQPCQSGLS